MTPTSRATQTTAALTGAYFGVLLLALGPMIDSQGPYSTYWLLLGAALVGIPGYIYVLGITRQQMVGAWLLEAPLLKRIAICLICCASVAAVSSLVYAARTNRV